MSNLANVVQQLRKERDQAQRRIEQIDGALDALSGLSSLRGSMAGPRHRNSSGRKRKTMSAEARKKIAAAQRARWARWKASRRSK